MRQRSLARISASRESPNLNAYAERFVRTVKESCLDRMILFGEGSLRKRDSTRIQAGRCG